MDYIKTKKLHTPIKVGTYLRNDGYGSRLVRVVEIVKDSALLETYGLLHKGNIKYPTRNITRTTGKIFQRYDGSYYVNTRNCHDYRGGSYTPVDIISKQYDAADAYAMGQSYGKYCQRTHRKWPNSKRPSYGMDSVTMHLGFGSPFVGTELQQTYANGIEAQLTGSN